MPAATTNGAYTGPSWGHGATAMPGALPPDFTNTQSYLPSQSQSQQQQQQQGTYFPHQQQQMPSQNFHQGLQQHGHGQLPHQQRNVELEHHYAPSSSQTNGTMQNMGMNFDGYSLNFNLAQQQYPSPPLTGPSQPQTLPQTTPPLSQYDPRQLQQPLPPHQVPVRQATNAFRHHQAAFNTGTVTGGGPPAAAPPAYVEQTATAIADGHSPAPLRGSPNGRVLGMNSKTPSPKSLPGPLAGPNGAYTTAGHGFTFTSPAIPGPLPQLSPPQPQLLGPQVYTPHAQQPTLKRQRYDNDGYDDGEDEGDVSGELDHDFDYSMQGGSQQYAQQSAGAGEQQGQEGDPKRPYVVFLFILEGHANIWCSKNWRLCSV